MTESNASATGPQIPAHVPPELVRDVDFYQITVGDDPQRDFKERFAGDPAIFYIPRTARDPQWGNWVITRREDILAVMQDPQTFSSRHIAGFDRALGGEEWLAYPVEIDPPDHTKFRALLNPLFAPARIKALEASMRAHTVGVIEAIVDAGEVDFQAVASELPAGIFSHLLGISIDETLAVMGNVRRILHSGYDQIARKAGLEWLMAFEQELIKRREHERGDDLISIVLDARVDGRPLTEKEIFGLFFFFLLAGLDTVAGALGLHFRHLAIDVPLRRRLVSDPSAIPDAIEELLRRYSQITTNRFVTRGVEFRGVSLRKGDNLILSLPLANLDDEVFSDPLAVDVDRQQSPHIAFGAGLHRCIGSNIARQQLRITYEEWLKRIPDFRLTPGAEVQAICSEALVLKNLPLSWAVMGLESTNDSPSHS
ncbi:MAG: cytochrome P450 [Pseudomonas sp.]|uniref:cytochrome P450 n=1 Tax=Pseudomonas sp. TaxID=306 RepID=UPI003982A72C